MVEVDATSVLIILVASAFTPPLVFLAVVRRTERYGREPWARVLRTFLWGAVFAVIIAIILELILFALYQRIDRVYVISAQIPNLVTIVLALVIAPLVEEFAKGVGVYLARPMIDEPEDGLVYGAASGLGFAASENLLYGLATLTEAGLGASLFVIGVRSISSALLHASSTAVFGYGIALQRVWPNARSPLRYYLVAVLMHSTFNLFASLEELERQSLGENAAYYGLAGAIILAVVAFLVIRWAIRRTDRQRVTW